MHPVKEASAQLCISERRVRYLLKEGRIEGRKLGRDWIVLSLDYNSKSKPKRN